MVERYHYSFRVGNLCVGMGKETISKNAHPTLFLRNKKMSFNSLKRIGFVKIVPKLCMNKVLKEIPIPLTSYSINNKAGELLIQELLHDYY